MNADEIVRALREIKVGCSKCLGENYTDCGADCSDRYILTAADLIKSLTAKVAAQDGQLAAILYQVDCLDFKEQQIESLQAQLAESQRREKAAVEDLETMARVRLFGFCTFCLHRGTPDARYKPCKGCQTPNGGRKNFEWRGPQEAGEGETK